jgi:myo-inositol-1(or 4)-monophosphatase
MSERALARRLEAAKEAALLAGQMLLNATADELLYQNKAKSDVVTILDTKSEHLIRDYLHSRFPEDNFLGEEEGLVVYGDGGTWIVDPVDGTNNLVHHIPGYTVSIAYEREVGCPVLGVVYSPMQDELFSAAEAQGAFLNGDPIACSSTASVRDAVTVAPPPLRVPTLLEKHFILYSEMCRESGDLRSFGSASLNLCYLAMGRVDAFFEYQLKYHDYGAAMVIIAESGGCFSSMLPGQTMPYSDILATNKALHPWYTQTIMRLVGESDATDQDILQ